MRWIAALLAMFWLGVAEAATVAPTVKDHGNGWASFRLCNNETGTGVCGPGSDVYVWDPFTALGGPKVLDNWTVYTTYSTASAFTCAIYTGNGGYHATARTLVLDDINKNETASFSGGFLTLWAECTVITGGNVTIELVGRQEN